MTSDYLREFDERHGVGNFVHDAVGETLFQEIRSDFEKALLASKEEGRAEAVAYIEKYNESVGGSRFVIVNRKFLEAAKEEKV